MWILFMLPTTIQDGRETQAGEVREGKDLIKGNQHAA